MKKDTITQKGNNNTAIMSSTVNISSIEYELASLFRAGKQDEAKLLFESMMRSINAQHPMYPHWGYKLSQEDGEAVLSHIPNYPEAQIKYPKLGKVKAKLPDRYRRFKNVDELLKHSYDKQEEIELDVEMLETWIGEHLIERIVSSKGEELKGFIIPEPFPEPIAMKLYIKKSSVSFDYLEMGVNKIEGQIVTLDNRKQEKAKFYVSVDIDKELSIASFKINISEEYKHDVEARLMINQFKLEMDKGGGIALKFLTEGKDFIASNKRLKSDHLLGNLAGYVKFLTDLFDIQDFYGVTFKLQDSFSEEELEKIHLLKLTMEDKAWESTYASTAVQVKGKNVVRDILKVDERELKNKGNLLTLEYLEISCELMGAKIQFKNSEEKYYNAVIIDREKISKKLEFMENDESIKIHLRPFNNKNNKFEYKLFI